MGKELTLEELKEWLDKMSTCFGNYEAEKANLRAEIKRREAETKCK